MALIDKLKKRPESSSKPKAAPPKEAGQPGAPSSGKAALERSYHQAFAEERWEEALDYLGQWSSLDPDNLNLVRKQGDLLLKLGRKKEALQKYWEVVLRLCASGQYRQAKALNQVILRVAPNLDQAQKKAMEIEAKLGFFSHPLFDELSEEEFGELVKKTHFRRVPKDTIVIREQEPGRSLFMICSGKVDVYVKDTKKGIAQQVARLGEGNFFGEGGFLTGKPRSATILTLEDTVLLELSKEDLDEVVKSHPRIGEIIQRYHQKRQNP